MDRRFILILLAVIAVIGGLFLFTRDNDSTSNTNGNDTSSAGVSSHSSGAGSDGVELIEYGDFQCPSCGQFFPIIEEVREKYGDRLKFTFRNFPLDTIHPNARAAHRAAEAAGIQGKFFDMYELLFQNQTTWSQLSNPVSLFEDYAVQLGLNLEKFKADFSSRAVNSTINADIDEGKEKWGANSTPTLILNGQKLVNTEVGSVELMSAKIDEAIAKSKSSTESTNSTSQ